MQLWRRLMNFRVREFLKSAGKGLHHSCLVHFFNIASYTSLFAMALDVCEESPCKWPCLPSIRSKLMLQTTKLNFDANKSFLKSTTEICLNVQVSPSMPTFVLAVLFFPVLVTLYLVAFFTVWILMNFMTHLLSPLSLRSEQH